MKIKNRITGLFNIEHPIIQAGMVWVSGWKLASAVSNSGGLGIIGAGSMKPDLLSEHIQKCKNTTSKPFAVNLPMLRKDADELVETIIKEKVKIVFSSAGHPGKYIEKFKNNRITVVHVVSSVKQGKKSEEVGCDAVVGEGVEAGGHNGLDEITTFCLIPQLADSLTIPVIAAGGISDGRGIAAALALGAEGVQIGTRFAATVESSAHQNYKDAVVSAGDNSTTLILKKIGMARLIKNKFSNEAIQTEFLKCASKEELMELLGQKRERLGIFEGDIDNGMMEAGQGSGLIKDVPTVKDLFGVLIKQYDDVIEKFYH